MPRDDWEPQESGAEGIDWQAVAVACTLCGEICKDQAASSKWWVEHRMKDEDHRLNAEQIGLGRPVSERGRNEQKYKLGLSQYVQLQKLLREHGTAWYFYAVMFGVSRAIADLNVEQMREAEEKRAEAIAERLQD